MSKDIVTEALDNAKAMKAAAVETAKRTLVEAMSSNLKAAVAQSINEQLNEAGAPAMVGGEKNQPSDYHDGKKGENLGTDRWGNEITVTGDTPNDNPVEKGDGPAVVEAGIEEMEEGDFLEFDDEEDDEFGDDDEYGDEDEMGMGDEEDLGEYLEMGYDEGYDEGHDDEMGGDEEFGDDPEGEDMEEVIEIMDEGDELDTDDIVEEMIGLDRENRKLRRENNRLVKAVTLLNNRIDEVNLFNARLAATSDLMRKVSLTKEEKERAVRLMDSAKTISEVKRSYRALYEGYRAGGRQVSNNRVNRRPVQRVVTEGSTSNSMNGEFARMGELAGIR
jgi:hypothetical protein